MNLPLVNTGKLFRKHRAPKGALRHGLSLLKEEEWVCVRKHRAPKGALRHVMSTNGMRRAKIGQTAPSAKRCIKTQRGRQRHRRSFPRVRNHRAPKGALRLEDPVSQVRQERQSQKAPSTKRCIKTQPKWMIVTLLTLSQSTEPPEFRT